MKQPHQVIHHTCPSADAFYLAAYADDPDGARVRRAIKRGMAAQKAAHGRQRIALDGYRSAYARRKDAEFHEFAQQLAKLRAASEASAP
jgi:hypothetical protein